MYIDYLYQNRMNEGKLNAVEEICKKENISFDEVAYLVTILTIKNY